MKRYLCFVIASVLGFAASPVQADEKAELAGKARAIFKKYCYSCHGQNGSAEGGFSYVLDFSKLVGKKVKAGDPEKSRLFKRMGIEKDMPPDYEDDLPRPNADEIAIVRAWIANDAPLPPADVVEKRPFLTTGDILEAIHADLAKLPRADRAFRRYFTLTHLHNNPLVLDKDFRLYRSALSKLLNSLSWQRDIVLPKPIDKHQTIFAIDLRDLEWERHGLWNEVLKRYPYGLKHDRYPEARKHRDQASEIYEWTGTPMPFLRADWFIASAGRPPLYHTLLYDEVLPELRKKPRDRSNPKNPKGMSAKHLEQHLGVDFRRNFFTDRLARAGFTKSGVSGQNRLVERHDAAHGAYWKSYDFRARTPRGNLFRFPLGPVFDGNPFPKLAFDHDGGEIIFNLPNGLQAYLLIDGKDNRIDEGPIDVVSDGKKTSGTNVIVNGLSCMACHAHGMIRDFSDDILKGTGVSGDAKDKVQKLYLAKEEMAKLLDKDEDRYLEALAEATQSFLKVGEDANKDIRDFAEPVAPIARWYLLQELDLVAVACELGFSDPKELAGAIKGNRKLLRWGLGTLVEGGTLKRAEWERLEGTSTFQDVAQELRLGHALR